jgi:hypothetical protein
MITFDDPGYAMSSATIDHVVPRSKGGHHTRRRNLVPACALCNQMRGNMDYSRFKPIAHEVILPLRRDLSVLCEALDEIGEAGMGTFVRSTGKRLGLIASDPGLPDEVGIRVYELDSVPYEFGGRWLRNYRTPPDGRWLPWATFFKDAVRYHGFGVEFGDVRVRAVERRRGHIEFDRFKMVTDAEWRLMQSFHSDESNAFLRFVGQNFFQWIHLTRGRDHLAILARHHGGKLPETYLFASSGPAALRIRDDLVAGWRERLTFRAAEPA